MELPDLAPLQDTRLFNLGGSAVTVGGVVAGVVIIVIAVVGGSSKGLGAAGISKEEEKVRGKTLLQEAKRRGIKVLVMHIGGDRRRGELTDAFIKAVAGLADRLIASLTVGKPSSSQALSCRHPSRKTHSPTSTTS